MPTIPRLRFLAENDTSNFYTVSTGLFTGIMTVLAISYQYKKESARRHADEIINYESKLALTQGFFQLNYILPKSFPSINDFKPFILSKPFKDKNIDMSDYDKYQFITLKLLSHEIVLNCSVEFLYTKKEASSEDKVLLGLVIPGQFFVVPIIYDYKEITIRIEYDTIMKEHITHKLKFNNGINEEAEKNGETIESSLRGEIVKSNSMLFPYVKASM